MQGTVVWFNLEKGLGVVRTDQGERLHLTRADFAPAEAPTTRCAGRAVTFERLATEAGDRAVNVAFPPTNADPRRARLRHSRAGTAL